jgi:predicted acylesterase/phospholipase RssA
MKRILVLSGGGVKGLAQARALRILEERIQKSVSNLFDLVVGSSVGAILGSVLSTGRVSAFLTEQMMIQTVPILFRRQWFPPIPRYDRTPFRKSWSELGLGAFRMAQCRTRFMCTAVSYEDNLTHFFKSWHPQEDDLLYSVQLRSWAAPLYFGKVSDRAGVWGDGGTGLFNCPISHALTQAERLGWLHKEPVHVLHIGTGYNLERRDRKRAEKLGPFGEILNFLQPDDGGWARYEAAKQAVKDAEARVGFIPGYSFQNVDLEIPKEMERLDGLKFMDEYLRMGNHFGGMIDYGALGG